MGPRITSTRRRKRWQVVASVFVYLLLGLWAWVESDDGSLLDAYAAANAWAVGFGFLDAAPPTNAGHTNAAGKFDFADALSYAQGAGRYFAVSTSAELVSRFSNATAGTYIRINPGTYSWSSVTLSGGSGSTARPIVIDGANLATLATITRGLKFSACSNVVVGRFAASNVAEYLAWIDGATRVRLTEITGTNIGSDKKQDGVIKITNSADYYHIDHCSLSSGGRHGIYLYWDLDDFNAQRQVSRFGRIQYNTITTNSQVPWAGSGAVFGVGEGFFRSYMSSDEYYSYQDSQLIFEHNHVKNCDQTEGVLLMVKVNTCALRYNFFDANDGELELRGGYGNVVAGNFVRNNKRASAQQLIVYGREHTIANNIFVMDSGSGRTQIRIWNGGGQRWLETKWSPVAETYNIAVINNTLIATGGWASNSSGNQAQIAIWGDNVTYKSVGDYTGDFQQPSAASHDITILNNIFRSTGTSYVRNSWVYTSGGGTYGGISFTVTPYNMTVANNCYYATGGASRGELYSSYDASPVASDPLLSAVYAPQSGSPVLDVGSYHSALTMDYFGNNRAIDAIDLGAIQVSLSPPAQRGAGLNRGMFRGGYMGGSV